MSIGESNKVSLSFIKETTPGTTPSTPAMKLIRYISEGLQENIVTTESEEIRDDRALSDLVKTDKSASGPINGEFSAAEYDEFLEAVLFTDATWTAVDETAITLAATATGFDDSGSGFVAAGLEVGQFIHISGFSNSAIDGYYRITSLAAGTIETYPAPPATETEGSSVTYVGSTISSGVTDHSYTVQRRFRDLSPNVYQNFRGCRLNSMSMELSVGALAQVGFELLGMSSESTETAISGQTETAKTTNAIMNCVGDVSNIVAVGSTITSAVSFTTLSLNYQNNLRELKAIGTLGSIDVRPGTINATATINPYFESKELLQAFNNSDYFTLSWQIQDGDGYVYIFSMPKVKFTQQQLAAGGKDQDMIINGTVRAVLDPDSLKTMRIDRFTP